MAEGKDEALLTSTADTQEVSGDDAVLAQLETLLSDDGSTAEAPVEETTEAVVEEGANEDEESDGSEESEDEKDVGEDSDNEDSEDDESENEEESDEIELSEEQLTEILGLDENGVQLSEEGELQFKVKIDKEESFVPLKEMVDSFQFESHIRKKSQKDAEERREFQETKTAELGRLNATMTDAVALVSHLEQQLTSRYSPEQLNQLRATKPDEWAAIQQEIANEGTFIKNVKANIQRVLQEQQQDAANQAKDRMATYVEEQTEKLYEHLPTWIDEKVAAKEYSAMKDAVIDAYGFTEDEMMKVNDHRIIRVMLDAIKGSAVKSDSPLKKRLKKVPRVIKSGSDKVTKSSVNKKKAAAKKLRIKTEGGSVQSIASALEDMI